MLGAGAPEATSSPRREVQPILAPAQALFSVAEVYPLKQKRPSAGLCHMTMPDRGAQSDVPSRSHPGLPGEVLLLPDMVFVRGLPSHGGLWKNRVVSSVPPFICSAGESAAGRNPAAHLTVLDKGHCRENRLGGSHPFRHSKKLALSKLRKTLVESNFMHYYGNETVSWKNFTPR